MHIASMSTRLKLLVLGTIALASAPAFAQEYAMRCESRNYAHSFCRTDGRVQSARMVRQNSSAPCILGRTWGWQGNGIWVSEGCAAEFLVRSSAPPPPPPQAGYVHCESREYRYSFCAVGRVRSAQLVRQRSQAPCVQGRTWGWTRDGIWVDQGCEGTFSVR